MDKREALKNMLSNLINDKREEATLDLHSYLTAKMKDVAGLSSRAEQSDVNDADDVQAETDFEDGDDDTAETGTEDLENDTEN